MYTLFFPNTQLSLFGHMTPKEAHSAGPAQPILGCTGRSPVPAATVHVREVSVLGAIFLRSNEECHMLLPQTSTGQISKHDPGDSPTNTVQPPPVSSPENNHSGLLGGSFASSMAGLAIIIEVFLREEFGTSILNTINTKL